MRNQCSIRTNDASHRGANSFETTHWSVVLAAGDEPSDQSRAAMTTLCSAYWPPLLHFVYRQISNKQEAEDLTQGFFRHLLEKNVVANADPVRGRFRSYLLTSLKNYLKNEWERRSAEKRGGGKQIIPIDAASALMNLPVDRELTPEQAFERQWAVTLLDRALNVLLHELTDAGKPELFEYLKQYLTKSDDAIGYAEVARQMGTSKAVVKTTVHRLRRRFRQIVRSEVAQTVGSAEDVDDEIRGLFRILSGEK